jgi:hypothetical protein
MDLLTYLLSLGNRWLPEAARDLLEKELEARNGKGLSSLKAAIGGEDVAKFVQKRRQGIRENLDAMYSQLGQGKSVPPDKLAAVLSEVQDRITTALSARITPRAVYNRIAPPDLTANAPDENWTQPLSLLLRAARLVRESLTDAYFPRRLSGLSFKDQEFMAAMDVFSDAILKGPDSHRAKAELEDLARIEAGDAKPKDKCVAVWKVISGATDLKN